MPDLAQVRPSGVWTPMRYHPTQARYFHEDQRFTICLKGRRSGGTDLTKRKKVIRTAQHTKHRDYRCVFAAPTRDQAKEIYWEWLKEAVPQSWLKRDPKETELLIDLVHGPSIRVMGLDKFRRLEGRPIDDLTVDEASDIKTGGLDLESMFIPLVSTPGRPGNLSFVGKPKLGAVHYKRLCDKATKTPGDPWWLYWWPSTDILSEEEISIARRTMDPHTFALEMEAKWVAPEGRVYYAYEQDVHFRLKLRQYYDPTAPLIVSLDFNKSPGVAAIGQEIRLPEELRRAHPYLAEVVMCWFGLVYIPKASNTPLVCRKFLADWGKHQGVVRFYGDESGKNSHTSSSEGSDWKLVRDYLQPTFGSRLRIYLPTGNPLVVDRVNALNSRFRMADGTVSELVDPDHCSELDDDLLATKWLKGSVDLDKRDESVTHLTDAIGYRAVFCHPLSGGRTVAHEF